MKIRLYILLACVFLSQHMMAVYYSVNIDYKTAAAMLAAYNAEGAVELMGLAGSAMRRRMLITSVSTVLSARISSPRLGMWPS